MAFRATRVILYGADMIGTVGGSCLILVALAYLVAKIKDVDSKILSNYSPDEHVYT